MKVTASQETKEEIYYHTHSALKILHPPTSLHVGGSNSIDTHAPDAGPEDILRITAGFYTQS
jgi:hypothetical protein